MNIYEAITEAMKTPPKDCCLSSNSLWSLRFRWRKDKDIGIKKALHLLQCQGYIITVQKESSEDFLSKIISK